MFVLKHWTMAASFWTVIASCVSLFQLAVVNREMRRATKENYLVALFAAYACSTVATVRTSRSPSPCHPFVAPPSFLPPLRLRRSHPAASVRNTLTLVAAGSASAQGKKKHFNVDMVKSANTCRDVQSKTAKRAPTASCHV